MNYYQLRINEENKVWKKYFTFNQYFYYKKEEVKFHLIHNLENVVNNLKIQALNSQGIVLDQNEFTKSTAPNFNRTQSIMLIKDSIFKKELFEDIKGLEFITIQIEGKFQNNYKLMNFTNVIDCVDHVNSIRKQFTFFSKLILLKSKIPKEIDGFFLSGWDLYGEFEIIVNDKLRNQLLKLEKVKDFLIFDEIQVI
ncbi:hypothetical protein [Flavobacterium sp. 140616W15]|uniref:hypothetical protein n=1 Tax=Flavobacterium sp. 140616W15 TaxID=2478552 RepID=UPI000F0CBB9D|nr:hypothetical protein [Flavobacterium sp. 140616W15]AYN04410.1 hypothetical protein EAG11_09625 [Flavobacterium sp. 140616W15]